MGNFFSGSRTGSIGNNSVNTAVMNDPIHKALFGNPQFHATAGPYAGVAPTLAAAQRGYATGPQGQAAPLTGTSQQLAGLGTELAPPAPAPVPAAVPITQRPVMGNPGQMMRPAIGAGGIYGY